MSDSASRAVPGIFGLPFFFPSYKMLCKYKMMMTMTMVIVIREEGSKLQGG